MIVLSNRQKVGICLGIFLLNLVVKGIGISANPIALDEPYSIYHAQFSVSHIYTTLLQGNNPPVYEVFLHYWIKTVGIDPFWVRLPSVVFSSLAACFWFLVALESLSLRAAVITALLFTFSTQYIYFSHEARSYAMVMLCISMASYFWVKLKNPHTARASYLLAAVFAAASIYVHYLCIVPIGIMALLLLLRQPLVPNTWLYLVVLSVALFPIGIILWQRIHAIQSDGLWGMAPKWTQLYGYLNIFLNGRLTVFVILVSFLGSFVYILFQKKLKSVFKEFQTGFLFDWALVFLVGYLFMYVVSYRYSIFIERYVQIIIPFFLLVLAGVVSLLLAQRKIYTYLGVFIVFVFIVQVNVYPSNERNPAKVADKMKEFDPMPHRIIHIYPAWYGYNLLYYYNKWIFSEPEIEAYIEREFSGFKRDTLEMGHPNEVASFPPAPEQILYIDAGEFFLNGNHKLFDMYAEEYDLQETDSIDKQTTLYYFIKKQN